MKRSAGFPRSLVALRLLAAGSVALLAVASSLAVGIECVSVATDGTQADDASYWGSLTPDGRFVAFTSRATNLVPGDTNGKGDVFVRDRAMGTTERVSISSAGEQGNEGSFWPRISADGRFVAFDSEATNLVSGDGNGKADVFLRDRLTGTTERISVADNESEANGFSHRGDISADGRCVAFYSEATNLVPGDTNGKRDVFLRDRTSNTTERVSVSSAGEQANDHSGFYDVCISPDGRFVLFDSGASNLAPWVHSGGSNVLVRDRLARTTEPLAIPAVYLACAEPDISADVRFVALSCGPDATELCSCNTCYVLLHDRLSGETLPIGCVGADYDQCRAHSISADGRYVSFSCTKVYWRMISGLVQWSDALRVYDRLTRDTVTLVTAHTNTSLLNSDISADGRFVLFESTASDLVAGDTNDSWDVFVLDRGGPEPAPRIVIGGGATCTNSQSTTLNLFFPQECAEMRLRNDPGDWGPWELKAWQKPWTLPAGDGVKKVCMQCRDAQGNVSLEACDDILLDTTPPANVSITINGGAACTDRLEVTLALSATDAYQMRFSSDGQTWSAWQDYAAAKSWTLSQGRGLKRVWFQARDACGNVSAVVSDSIWLILFDDVLCQYAPRAYIEALAQRSVVSGCTTSPPRYCPFYAATRAFMAEALCKAAGKTWLDRATPTFADVPKTHPAYGWIERLTDAASWGGVPVTDGCGWQGWQKLFCPDASVTREQAAKFICRATGKRPMPICSGVFADVPSVRSFCGFVERLADAASWPGGAAVTSGCVCPSGYPGGARCYCPRSNVTRGQMAVFIVRAFGIPL
jgi:Tol biopolymer transport system component